MGHLTVTKIKNLKPKKDKPYFTLDKNYLYLKIYPTGTKSWVTRYSFKNNFNKNQIITHTIGEFPVISLSEAREINKKIINNLKDGILPQKQTARSNINNTLENTFERWSDEWLSSKTQNTPKTLQGIKGRLKNHILPKLGKEHMEVIRPLTLQNLINSITNKGTIETAKRCLDIVRGVFHYYIKYSDKNISNPANFVEIKNSLPQKNHPALTDPKEIKQLLLDIDNYAIRGEYLTSQCLKLLPYLALRPGELYSLKWRYIDFTHNQITIPAENMKRNREHIVPLAKQPLEILIEIKKLTGHSPYVFHSPSTKSGFISNNTASKALERLGYKGKQTPHGFRHMFSTLLNEQGYNPDHIEKQLAHESENKIRGIYNKAQYIDDRTKMMQDWADYIDSLNPNKNKQKI